MKQSEKDNCWKVTSRHCLIDGLSAVRWFSTAHTDLLLVSKQTCYLTTAWNWDIFPILLERCHKFSEQAVKRGIPAGDEPICTELQELTVAGGSTHRSHRHWRAPHSGSLCMIALISGGWGKKWNGYIIAWGPRINTSSTGRYRLCQV